MGQLHKHRKKNSARIIHRSQHSVFYDHRFFGVSKRDRIQKSRHSSFLCSFLQSFKPIRRNQPIIRVVIAEPESPKVRPTTTKEVAQHSSHKLQLIRRPVGIQPWFTGYIFVQVIIRFFSFNLKLICTCEFFKKLLLRRMQFQLFEKLTSAN